MSERAIPELSVDTQILERRLLDVSVGEIVSYEELSKTIGRDVQRKAHHLLTTAVRRVLRDKQIVFAAVHGKGLKRLDDAGVLGVGEAAIAAIGRKSRRTVKKMACADYKALKPEERTQHNVIVSQLGVLAHITSSSVQKKLEASAGHEKLPVAKMLAAVAESL